MDGGVVFSPEVLFLGALPLALVIDTRAWCNFKIKHRKTE